MTITLTDEQTNMARHALGLDYGRTRSYRNRYLATAGGPEFKAWEQMRHAGLAQRGDFHINTCFFHLTRAGAEAVLRPGESLDPEDFPETAKRIDVV